MTLVYIDCWYKDNQGKTRAPVQMQVRIDMKGDIKSQVYKQRGTWGTMALDSYRISGRA
jgi:hypothetical protein